MGFASGFQVGAQAVERGLRMRDENEQRERIKAAMGLTAQEVEQRQATPDELGRARAEAQAMAAQDAEVFGLTPQEQVFYAPQMPVEGQRIGLNRYQVGQQSFDRMPTQNELEAVRYGAAANVLAERDPVAAQRMRRELQIAKQQDELYPLQKQQLQGAIDLQGVQTAGARQQGLLTDLSLKAAGRNETELQNASNFAKFSAENPDATPAVLKEAAFKQFNFTPDQWKKTVNTRLGIKEDEQKEFVLKIKDKLKGKNLTQLGSLYNSDPDFDDKTDLAIVPGKGGAVTLNFIDKATGKIKEVLPFKNSALATEYLNKQAIEPETIGSWMMALRKTETGIAADEARIRASDAQTRDAGKSAIEKNLATLQRLGIPVSPEDVRAMAGIKPEKLSPEAAAQLEAITANLKGNESPKALAEARAAITDLFRGEGLKQRNTTIVRGLKTANSKNDLPAAIKQLRDAGVGDETIVGLAKQAGVTLPPSFAPAAPAPAPATATAPAAAVSPRTGLSSGQQQYGPLTPMATIEADARAGVPAAVAYLKQMADRDRARTENAMRAAQGE